MGTSLCFADRLNPRRLRAVIELLLLTGICTARIEPGLPDQPPEIVVICQHVTVSKPYSLVHSSTHFAENGLVLCGTVRSKIRRGRGKPSAERFLTTGANGRSGTEDLRCRDEFDNPAINKALVYKLGTPHRRRTLGYTPDVMQIPQTQTRYIAVVAVAMPYPQHALTSWPKPHLVETSKLAYTLAHRAQSAT